MCGYMQNTVKLLTELYSQSKWKNKIISNVQRTLFDIDLIGLCCCKCENKLTNYVQKWTDRFINVHDNNLFDQVFNQHNIMASKECANNRHLKK